MKSLITTRNLTMTDDPILSKAEIAPGILPFSLQTLDRLVSKGKFPKPIQLSDRRVGWRKSIVLAWLSALENAV